MMISNFTTKLSSIMMNVGSSVFSAVSTDIGSDSQFMSIEGLAGSFISILGELLYAIVKWILYFVDILFIYVQQLSGLNMDTSSLNKMISKESDMVFNFLLSNSTIVSNIIRSLMGIALVLIIVSSIIAIVKTQFDALKTGKATSVNGVLIQGFKSIILMFITPMIILVGIVSSNLLLKALYEATNVTNTSSLSANIFSVSTTSANLYRQYAIDKKRVPITFDFSEQEEILEYYKSGGGSSKMKEYLTSAENTIYATFLMFCDDNFDNYDALEAGDKSALDAYYKTYDSKIGASSTSVLTQYQKIRSHYQEYFVMADIVDYAVGTSEIMYIRTIQNVLNSMLTLPKEVGEEIFNNFVGDFGLTFYDKEGISNQTPLFDPMLENSYEKYKEFNWDVIRYTSNYYSVNELNEPAARKQIEYNHIKYAEDELNGAVFIMTAKKTVTFNGVTYSYFYPVTKGYKTSSGNEFLSDYIDRNQIISAKGIFTSKGYPTAIMHSIGTNETIFYRDEIETITIADSKNVIITYFEQQEESGGVFGKIISFFKKLFDPNQWIPNLAADTDKIVQTYTKQTVTAGKLESGELHIGYLFADNLSSKIAANMYGLKISSLYNTLNINYLVLTFGAVLLVKICFLAVFALIKRAYDLFLIIMTYPAACATLPLYGEGNSANPYSTWMQSFLGKLFTTYGLMLGINFVLMLFPVIQTVKVFTPEDVAGTLAVSRISKLFSGLGMSINFQTNLLNLVVAILFELVAFAFLDVDGKSGSPGIYGLIMRIVDPDSKEDLYAGNPGAMMMKTVSDAGHMLGKGISMLVGASSIFSLVTKKGRARLAERVKETVKNKGPGSALIKEGINKVKLAGAKGQEAAAALDLMNSLKNGGSADDVKAKMQALTQAQEGIVGKKSNDAKKAPSGRAGGIQSDQLNEAMKKEESIQNNKEANKKAMKDATARGQGEVIGHRQTDEEKREEERYENMYKDEYERKKAMDYDKQNQAPKEEPKEESKEESKSDSGSNK